MMWRAFVVVVCLGLIWGWVLPKADAAEKRAKRNHASQKSIPVAAPDSTVEKKADVSAGDVAPRMVLRATATPTSDGRPKNLVGRDMAPAGASESLADRTRRDEPILTALPSPAGVPGGRLTSDPAAPQTSHTPSLVDRGQVGALLTPEASLKSVGTLPTGQENLKSAATFPTGKEYLEIEVSHSSHIFRLYSETSLGEKKELLHECRIGLGGPEFRTPVGVYFVTHIYDEDPWWIPPKDRAWAAGNTPSRRVYGGTMAPLLKKLPVRKKNDPAGPEEKIAGPVKLEDYGYRFHGTNQPRSIGRNQSHGCVRMLPDDARKVATLIKERVGISERKQSENGNFVVLNAPVRLNLIQ